MSDLEVKALLDEIDRNFAKNKAAEDRKHRRATIQIALAAAALPVILNIFVFIGNLSRVETKVDVLSAPDFVHQNAISEKEFNHFSKALDTRLEGIEKKQFSQDAHLIRIEEKLDAYIRKK